MEPPRLSGHAQRHQHPGADEPSPLAPYGKLRPPASDDHKTTALCESSVLNMDGGDSTARRLRRRDFVRGRWEVELNDYTRHCVPNGWMVCLLPCVSVAQISARIGADSFGAALAKQAAFNFVVWALVLLELVYCYLYMTSIFGDGGAGTVTPPLVIFSACLTVSVVSFLWVRALAGLRARVRERFAIAGTASDDQCAMAWCTPCALAQMATQVKSYTPGSCEMRAPDALPPYIP